MAAARARSPVIATPPPPPAHRAFIAVPPRPVVSFNKGKARALPLPKSGRPTLDLQAQKRMADRLRRAEASGRADSDEVHRVGDRVSRLLARIASADFFVYSATAVARLTKWSVELRLGRSAVANAPIKRRSVASAQTPGLVARSCRRRSALLVVAPRARSLVSATSRELQGLPCGLHESSAPLQLLLGPYS